MAYPHHFLFAFGGTLLAGTEIWTNTIRFANTGEAGEQYDLQAICDGMTQAVATAFTTSIPGTLGNSSAQSLEWGKFNPIGPDGRYTSPSETIRHDLADPGVKGDTAPPSYAPQLSLCVSWRTARARGRASKGRIYQPMPRYSIGTNGHIPSVTTLDVAAGWARLIESLNDVATDSLGNGPLASVVSGVDASFEPITHVQVGSVMDTQRSRRNALTEVYSRVEVN